MPYCSIVSRNSARVEVPTDHRGDAAADHQVADRVEQSGAVHQRRSGHVARPGLADTFLGRSQILLRRQAFAVVGVEHAEQVVLPPHHALGHAGGAAGVEQQEVVPRSTPWPLHVVDGAGIRGVFVGPCPRRAWAAPVVDPEPGGDPRNPRQDRLDLCDEGAMKNHRGDVAVVPEVDEFVAGIAIVGVDRGEARLERRKRRLEVLGGVVEVLRDLVLFGGARRVEQRSGDAVGPPVHLDPRDLAITLLLSQGVAESDRNGLPQIGQIPAVRAVRGDSGRSGARCSRRVTVPTSADGVRIGRSRDQSEGLVERRVICSVPRVIHIAVTCERARHTTRARVRSGHVPTRKRDT